MVHWRLGAKLRLTEHEHRFVEIGDRGGPIRHCGFRNIS